MPHPQRITTPPRSATDVAVAAPAAHFLPIAGMAERLRSRCPIPRSTRMSERSLVSRSTIAAAHRLRQGVVAGRLLRNLPPKENP
jgi:hypothetical protein